MSIWYEKEPQYTENKTCPICGRNLSEVPAHQLVGVGELMNIYTCSDEHSKEFVRQVWKLSKRNDRADNLNTVKIGSQEWMAENLNLVDDGLSKDHWKNPKNGEVYYSWDAAVRLAKKVPGFHLPTSNEWNQLAEACGCAYEGIKESNSDLQDYNNTNELKKKLVIKLVGWYETGNKDFFSIKSIAGFWTSAEKDNRDAYKRHFGNGDYMRSCHFYKKYGLSVRLVKDSV